MLPSQSYAPHPAPFQAQQAGMPHHSSPQYDQSMNGQVTADITPTPNMHMAIIPDPQQVAMAGQMQGMPVPAPIGAYHSMASPHTRTGDVHSRSMESAPAFPVAPAVSTPSELPPVYHPRVRALETYGGVDLGLMGHLGAELDYHRPNVPSFSELGVVDIHSLIKSLQSGLHAEVRLALDTLAVLTVEPRFQLSLPDCDDLLESLMDCADEQAEILIDHAPEVSDVIQISSYEDVIRATRLEVDALQDVHEFGSVEYQLDRAADRLICITTILRNLSFAECNQPLLSDPIVIRPIAAVIRSLGTRNMLLRTHLNTLDLMKDIVIFLSNVSQIIELPGKEEALSLLHFLLAFAPCPGPTGRIGGRSTIMFTAYQPSLHRYLPPAVDSLAKLLVRDEPNRTLYRNIFLNDPTSVPAYDLLTRTFALAVSPVLETGQPNPLPIVMARKPFIVQGMLAAEVLASLAPGPETGLARSWLSSADGFAQHLLRLVCLLSTDQSLIASRNLNITAGRGRDPEPSTFASITHRGIAVLCRLAEKSRRADDVDDDDDHYHHHPPAAMAAAAAAAAAGAEAAAPADTSIPRPTGALLKKETLLGALLNHGIDAAVVKELCIYAGLEA